jgi:arylsulfatase A-like enzyme
MVKAPGVEASRSDQQVELADLYHTVLDFADVDAVGEPLDRTRSLLSADYRDFAAGEYAFVEYHRPVVELKQLETKAAEAGIDLEEESRYYSRMRAARRPDGKYIRNERIGDEAYRLDRDPDETENLAGGDDDVVADVEAALREFEARVGEAWDDDYDPDADVLDDMDETTQDRLRDLGYLE